MSYKERYVLVTILSLVFILVTSDIIGDSLDGVEFWHLLIEAMIGIISLAGIFYVIKDSFRTKKQVKIFKAEADMWRAESKKYIQGLSIAIDQQLIKWKLTEAEKEVAFLLLKGLSLKEIAEIRNTTEKTARVQSMAIYQKANLSGRSELSAFFLEDLLVPNNSRSNQ